jgi:hypothetical protein
MLALARPFYGRDNARPFPVTHAYIFHMARTTSGRFEGHHFGIICMKKADWHRAYIFVMVVSETLQIGLAIGILKIIASV